MSRIRKWAADEFFRLNVQKAAVFAFMSEMILLVPFIFVCTFIYGAAKAVMDPKKIGGFLKILSREKGLTQEQLAGIAIAGFGVLRILACFSHKRIPFMLNL